MASFRSAPTTFHSKGSLGMKHKCGRRCRACCYNRMRHIGKGGLVSSFSAQSEDVIVQEGITRSNAFTRACKSMNVTKVARMLSSGSFEVQQMHVELVRENGLLRDTLVHAAAQMMGIDVLSPRCPDVMALPRFLAEYIIERELAFVVQRSNRFLTMERGSLNIGKLGNCRTIFYNIFSFMRGDEMQAWPALSCAFAFDVCDATEFARLHYQNTFAICYLEWLTHAS